MQEKDRPEEHLEEARRDAAGRTIEDQGAEGDLTEATHGRETEAPERREGEVPPSD
jgi:hypothetical protein